MSFSLQIPLLSNIDLKNRLRQQSLCCRTRILRSSTSTTTIDYEMATQASLSVEMWAPRTNGNKRTGRRMRGLVRLGLRLASKRYGDVIMRESPAYLFFAAFKHSENGDWTHLTVKGFSANDIMVCAFHIEEDDQSLDRAWTYEFGVAASLTVWQAENIRVEHVRMNTPTQDCIFNHTNKEHCGDLTLREAPCEHDLTLTEIRCERD
ncbi:hypothetical protein DXG01_004448, partial [Tephrocybe rancida]